VGTKKIIRITRENKTYLRNTMYLNIAHALKTSRNGQPFRYI
jgi:hypothetical protein